MGESQQMPVICPLCGRPVLGGAGGRRSGDAVMAEILDLRILHRDNGPWYQFSWRAAPEEWEKTLAAVKRIPLDDREWDPERKVWRVRATGDTALLLSLAFENFWSALDALQSQRSLFEEVEA